MSSHRRPWFPWYPKDYVADEKTRGLSDDADLLYRRVLDIIWQANALQLPNNCTKLALQIARGWSQERFENAWSEIQTPGFELLKTSECGQWVYSQRLMGEAQKIENISKIRSESARKTNAKQKHSKSTAKAQQKHRHTDTYTHTDKRLKDPPNPPRGKVSVVKSYQYPEWLNHTLWADFVKMRTKIKKPITTEKTISNLIGALHALIVAGHRQEDVIQKSIDSCWQSFYPPKDGKKSNWQQDANAQACKEFLEDERIR